MIVPFELVDARLTRVIVPAFGHTDRAAPDRLPTPKLVSMTRPAPVPLSQ